MRIRKGEKGFTLIELMIVVAIIGILAAIAIPQFAQMRIRSFNAAAQTDLRNAMTAQEAYFADSQTYASSTALLTPTAVGFATTTNVTTSVTGTANTGYSMNSIHSAGTSTYTVIGPGGSIGGS